MDKTLRSQRICVYVLKKKFHNRKRRATFALMSTTSGDLRTILRSPYQALEAATEQVGLCKGFRYCKTQSDQKKESRDSGLLFAELKR